MNITHHQREEGSDGTDILGPLLTGEEGEVSPSIAAIVNDLESNLDMSLRNK